MGIQDRDSNICNKLSLREDIKLQDKTDFCSVGICICYGGLCQVQFHIRIL